MATKKRIYADIQKVEEQEDGTLKVWGFASSGAVDSDGETITPEAMKAALPDYMKFGAVREMHQSIAAGTAFEASVDDTTGKTSFGAHVVDPIAVKKVQTGVYKGFSIGGKVTSRDPLCKTTIKGINLIEVSLVDRPANPEAVFTMYKAASTPEDDVAELAEMLDAGEVTPAQLLELIQKSKQADTPVEATGSTSVPPKGGLPADPVKTEEGAVKKGMYSVADFGMLLNSLGYMVEDAMWETEYEGDASPIPATMFKWLQDGVEIFRGMAAEETAEMLARLRGLPVVTSKAEVVAKAGAKFSKATKVALAKIHGACKEAAAHLDGLGYGEDDADDAADKTAASAGDTIGIVSNEPSEDVAKAVSVAIAPLNEDLAKVRKENEDLRAEVTKLKAEPAPGKALLKAMNKAQDVTTLTPELDESTAPKEGTAERAEYEMKKVFATGGRVLGR